MGYQLNIGETGIKIEIYFDEYSTNSYFYRNPYFFDLSFEELKPYLTEEFKNLIGL